ncbi:MAG: NADH:ubiquinone reductase (Na(+)-transporting) subunit B [Rhodospirillales bacterium]|nr:NADH:ubiquinone reductase (Na(+)-transporting) subunit B [Rhodospirillales bacterium]
MKGDLAATPPGVTRHAPHVRQAADLRWIMNRMTLALVPCLLIGLWNTGLQANLAMQALGAEKIPGWRGALLEALGIGGDSASPWDSLWLGLLYFLPVYAVAAVTVRLWETVFARLRRRELMPGGMVTALIYALILPPAAPLWQVALGISFAVVIGKEIFGGTGKNFVNPAALGLAFLSLSYPNEMAGDPIWTGIAGYGGTLAFNSAAAAGMDAVVRSGVTWTDSFLGFVQGAPGETSALACLLGASVLIVAGIASWRIMAGVVIGGVASALLFNTLGGALGGEAAPIFTVPWYWHVTLGSFAFGAVFLATDPASAAATDPGRWVYGLLIGFMIVLIRVANPTHPDGVIVAILLGNIFAPLIDHAVMRVNIAKRARRCV